MTTPTRKQAEADLAEKRRVLDVMREMRKLIEVMIANQLKDIQQLRHDHKGL